MTNSIAYNPALKQRGSLDVWLIRICTRCRDHAVAPAVLLLFSDSAIELCLTLKRLFTLPLRQATGLVARLLKLADLDCPVPDHTTLCRRQKTLPVTLGGRPSSGGLHLLVDSTGIKMMGEGEWKTRKHGASYRRQWRKVHIGIDAEKLDIRAIEATTNAIGDAPVFPDLLAQIPADEKSSSVGGDGAYDTKKCHAGIAEREAQAIIPVCRNGRPWKEDGPGVQARSETLRAIKRLGRTIWKKWSGYHRRSLVETKMHCFKLLGQRVMARTFNRQITDFKVRSAILNRFSQIGASITVRVP
ncbi:IS5 family transposase [Sphingobium sp. AS12]|uniref:IS5 family transposase n=1 Tax=Sphingobium sp. AS12 TaxID=2849495 RepID=UPI001C316163|nr:IS5 family transposase [Sphingobium sp. AS12]MBV2149741.1 IS5 family transposase [Sphingobium sp. AS12]